jgi:hypothetical protein
VSAPRDVPVAGQRADLLSRIVANDSRTEHLNTNGLPRNRCRLLLRRFRGAWHRWLGEEFGGRALLWSCVCFGAFRLTANCGRDGAKEDSVA